MRPPARRRPALAVLIALVVGAMALPGLAGCTAERGGEQAGSAPASTPVTTPPTTQGAPTASPSPARPRPGLRRELLRMAALDQAVRGGPAPAGVDPGTLVIDQVDRDNQARLVEILDEHGWPGWGLVGRRGSTAAWTVAQHADLDLALQRRCLELLTAAAAREDASPGDLAYLTDRVLVAEGRPQQYGTQWQADARGRWTPRTPIADRADVDRRRARAGLGSLRDYVEELRSSAFR